MPRRFPIAQFPNPPLIVAMAAGALARTAEGTIARDAALVSQLALLVWAYQEMTTGANWFRRLLGLGGAAYGVAALKRLSSMPTGG
jgi:hypothetical protein